MSRSLFQMEDAPFQDSRAGSEEDFLEYDDDDPVFNCDACKRRRRLTGVEKALIAFGVVCVIIIIALAAHIGKKKDVKGKCSNRLTRRRNLFQILTLKYHNIT